MANNQNEEDEKRRWKTAADSFESLRSNYKTVLDKSRGLSSIGMTLYSEELKNSWKEGLTCCGKYHLQFYGIAEQSDIRSFFRITSWGWIEVEGLGWVYMISRIALYVRILDGLNRQLPFVDSSS
jgi:hypothetical protein